MLKMILKMGVDKEKKDDDFKKEIKNLFSGYCKNKTKDDLENNLTNEPLKPSKIGVNPNHTVPCGNRDFQHAEGQKNSQLGEPRMQYGDEEQPISNNYIHVYYPPVNYTPVYYTPVNYTPVYYTTVNYTPDNTPSNYTVVDLTSISEVKPELHENDLEVQEFAESTAEHVKSLSQLFAVSGTFNIEGREIELEGNAPEKSLDMLISGINHFLEHENVSKRERDAVLAMNTTLKQTLQFKTENVSREEISNLAQSQEVTAFDQGWSGHDTYGLILNRHRNLKKRILFVELNRGVESDHHTSLKNNKINSAFAIKLSRSSDIDYTVQNAIYAADYDKQYASNVIYEVFPSYYPTFTSRLTDVAQSPQRVGSCTGASAKALTKLLLQVEMGSRKEGEKLYDKLIAFVKMDKFVEGYLKTAHYQKLTNSEEDVPQSYLDLFRPKFTHHNNCGKLTQDIQLIQKITQRLSDSDTDAAALLRPLNTFIRSIN